MKSDDKQKKEQKRKQHTICVRFSEEEYQAVKSIAEVKDKSISTLVRQSAIMYLQNFAEHENLFSKLKTGDPQETTQTIFDVLTKHTDTMDKSIKKLEDQMLKKFDLLDVLARKQIFQFFLHNRELTPEVYGEMERAANRRTKAFLEDVK